MIITECVLHGFKGFAQPFTLHLKPGLNLVTGGNESGKSTLCEGILSALYASPSSSAYLNWSYPEVCRIHLFLSTPRGRFRLVKDFVRRSAELSEWSPAKAAFLSRTQEPSSVSEHLSKELGGINEAAYRTLFFLQPPSRIPAPVTLEPTPSPHPPGAPPSAGNSREESQGRLQQLRGYLNTYRNIRETELLLDTLRTQHDEARASLQGLVALEEERRAIREALDRLRPLEDLTVAAILPQITEYQKALANREDEIRGLEEKMEEERARLALIPSTPLARHRLFLSGGGLLLLALVAAQFLPVVGAGIFLGLGCIAAALAQYFSWGQKRSQIRKGLQALEHQMEKGLDLRINRQFQSLLDLLPRTGCQDVSALATRLRQRDALKEKLTRLDEQIAELSAGTDSAVLEEKKRRLEEAIQVAEGELGSLGYVPEPLDVQREIEDLERGTVSPEGPALRSRERPPPVANLLGALEKLLGGLSASLVSALETQAGKLITDITAGRYTRIRRTPENSLLLARAGNQEGRSLEEVSDGAQDVAVLAWHLALLSVVPPALSVPLLMDEAFLRVDGERRKRLLPFLQHLARTQQIILFCREAWIPPEAAHTVSLGRAIDRTPPARLA